MRSLGRQIRWGVLLPLMCVAWYSGRYYQGVQAECSVTLDKVMLTTQSGQPGVFRGTLDFNLPRRQGYYEILNPSGGLVWSGTFYLQPNMDWTGEIVSLTILDVVSSISSLAGASNTANLGKGKTLPFSFEYIDEHVAWLRLGSFVTFCNRSDAYLDSGLK